MTNLNTRILTMGTPLPDDLLPLLADADRAISAMTGEQEREAKTELLIQVRQGASNMLVVRDGERPICFIAIRLDDNDAMLRLGYITPDSTDKSRAVLKLSIAALKGHGFNSIASTFNWPQKEVFGQAAEAAGFDRVDRVNMVRWPDAGSFCSSLHEGITIMPWSARHSEAASRIIFENAFLGDKAFHRPYRTLDGSKAYLDSILSGRYGEFMPELSFVACHDRTQVGQVLATRLSRTGINIVDLAVDKDHRGRGIASSLISALIKANSATLREDIVLTVTRSNQTALRLYRRLGFEVTDDVSYYICEDVGEEGGPDLPTNR